MLKKDKKNKLRPTLFPVEVLYEIIKVFEFGTIKYKINSWKRLVKQKPMDYYDAALRHIYKDLSGEDRDEESSLLHLAHAIVNLIFLIWLKLNKKK